jgi:hypothetical protein
VVKRKRKPKPDLDDAFFAKLKQDDAIESIRAGLRQAELGLGRPADEVFADLRRLNKTKIIKGQSKRKKK